MQLQPYSPEEEQLLLRMRSENKTIKDIAAAIGRSPKSVEKKLAKLKMRGTDTPIGITAPPYSPDEEQLLKEMWESYKPVSEISSEIRRSQSSIYSKARKLGISRDKSMVHQVRLFEELSDQEEQIIVGSLLGDGFITKCFRKNGYHQFVERHSLKQENYLRWKGDFLGNQGSFIGYETYQNSIKIKLRTRSGLLWDDLRSKWYPEGNKIVDINNIKNIDYLGLTCLIGDDGSAKGNSMIICTMGFPQDENQLLADFLSDKFHCQFLVRSSYNKIYEKTYYYLFIPTKSWRFLRPKLGESPPDLEYKFNKVLD